MISLALFSSVLLSAAAPTAFTITSVGPSEWSSGDAVYQLAVSSGDSDGDGVPDEGILKIRCAAGNQIMSAILTPREAGSGMASGKRQHGSVSIVKEWGPATPQLGKLKASWDLKNGTKRTASAASEVTLSGADGLCAEAQAAVKATKSRSNIQNN